MMSEQYTPRTDEVRNGYAYNEWDFYPEKEDAPRREEFDRWLASVKAEAWENGLNTGIGYAAVMHLVVSEPQNPYIPND